jgi:lysozyme
MNISDAGVKLIEDFEELRLVAYQDQDQKGVWTIGYGHTGPEVVQGLTCTEAEADAWLIADTQSAVRGVNASLTKFCTQNEFDALCSFTFNVGVGAEEHSTMIKLVNAGDIQGAAAEFPKWDHINGVENAGLKRRRLAEQALFIS